MPTGRTSNKMKEWEPRPAKPGPWRAGQREHWNPGALPRRLTYPLVETKVRSESSSTRRRILCDRLGMQQLRTSFLTIGILPLVTDEAAPQRSCNRREALPRRQLVVTHLLSERLSRNSILALELTAFTDLNSKLGGARLRLGYGAHSTEDTAKLA